MSHTLKKKVEYRMPHDDQAPLARSVVRMGGKLLGRGKHKLYSSTEEGFGFLLPGWRFPIVYQESGNMAMDDYNGSWGNVKDLEKLKDIYSQEAARAAAEALGWMTQSEDNGDLTIFHPSGGQVRVPLGVDEAVDATGFVGALCDEATAPIMAAIGGKGLEVRKPEYEIETANVRQTGEGP